MSSSNGNAKKASVGGASSTTSGERTKSILKAPAAEEVKQGSQMPAFRVDLKYRNTLPPVPFDPYFLEIPFAPDFLWGYRPSTLEKNYKYRIHMNPPQIIDDMIDPLGAEEWAKATELDEKDKALQRKEGGEVKATSKSLRVNREAKTWMLKTIYTRENVHRQPMMEYAEELADPSTYIVQDEDEDARMEMIEQQFKIANSSEPLPAPPGKQIKRVLPFLPARVLREINLNLLRFKVGERVMKDDAEQEKDDPWVVDNAILIHRHSERDDDDESEKKKNELSPLSLFLPKKTKASTSGGNDDDEEDLFAEEEEPTATTNTTSVGATYDTKRVEYIREYDVQKIAAKGKSDRIALFFDEDAVRYVEIEPESLRLFRVKRPGDDERLEIESSVDLTLRLDPTKEEKKQRAKRRRTIEGGDLVLASESA